MELACKNPAADCAFAGVLSETTCALEFGNKPAPCAFALKLGDALTVTKHDSSAAISGGDRA